MTRPDAVSHKSRQTLFAAFAILLIALLFLACNRPQHRADDLVFRDWYVATPMGNGTMTVAYGSIENVGGGERHLVAVSLSCADSAALHETVTAGGRVSMHALPSVIIQPAGEARFAPGGKHLMVFGLKKSEECRAKFTFGAEEAVFAIPVRPRDLK